MKYDANHHFGERLRMLLVQPYVTVAELRSLLRRRGLFCGNSSKEELIPILTGGLLNFHELNHLAELATVREQAPKRRTSFVRCPATEPLSEVVAAEVTVAELLPVEFSNFEVVTITPFVAVGGDPDRLQLDYTVKRNDLSRDWTTSEKEFTGTVVAQKKGEVLQFVAVHTSPETEQLNNAIKRNVVERLKEFSPDVSEEKLTFHSFENRQRVEFILNFIKTKSALLSFERATDVGVRLVENLEIALRDELKWMLNRVSELRIAGEAVHEIDFLTDEGYYESIILTRMEARFSFTTESARGHFDVVFEFAEYSRRKIEAEFQIGIRNIRLIDGHTKVSTKELEKQFFDELDDWKNKFLADRRDT